MPDTQSDPTRFSDSVVIFAKAPRLGQVKTRLAAAIGEPTALNFYRETLFTVTARLAANAQWRIVLAVTPDTSVDEPEIWPPGVGRVPQGEGDLGARMLRFLERARPVAPVLIAGSDIPQLNAGHIARAVRQLTTADLVFGPASDGGYWLIGTSRPPPATLFKDVRWSTEHALADTQRNADSLTIALADTLADVDDGADYTQFLAQR